MSRAQYDVFTHSTMLFLFTHAMRDIKRFFRFKSWVNVTLCFQSIFNFSEWEFLIQKEIHLSWCKRSETPRCLSVACVISMLIYNVNLPRHMFINNDMFCKFSWKLQAHEKPKGSAEKISFKWHIVAWLFLFLDLGIL